MGNKTAKYIWAVLNFVAVVWLALGGVGGRAFGQTLIGKTVRLNDGTDNVYSVFGEQDIKERVNVKNYADGNTSDSLVWSGVGTDFYLRKNRRGNLITVAKSGGDYDKIQDAVDAATTGTTVLVFPGEYAEEVSISKAIALIGTDKTNCIIKKSVAGNGVLGDHLVTVETGIASGVVEIRGLTMWNTYGSYSSTALMVISPAKVFDCLLIGNHADTLIVGRGTTYIDNCIVTGLYDTVSILGQSTSYNTYINNCQITATNSGSNTMPIWVGNNNVTANISNCDLITASATGSGINVSNDSGKTIRLNIVNCRSIKSDYTPMPLFYNAYGTGTTAYIANCQYSALGNANVTANYLASSAVNAIGDSVIDGDLGVTGDITGTFSGVANLIGASKFEGEASLAEFTFKGYDDNDCVWNSGDDVTLPLWTFGGDTTLYRGAANTLKTDDAFDAASLKIGAAKFTVDANGNITKINNVTTSFPSSQGDANTYLKNDGSGNLSWAEGGGGGATGDIEVDSIKVGTAAVPSSGIGSQGDIATNGILRGNSLTINGTSVITSARALQNVTLPSHNHAGTDINSGTVADARLSSNIPKKDSVNAFTNFVRIEKTATENLLTLTGGTITTQKHVLKVTGTMPATADPGTFNRLVEVQATSGNSGQNEYPFNMELRSGGTASCFSAAGRFYNERAGTGALGFGSWGKASNNGIAAQAAATTSGYNYGGTFDARGGDLSVGVEGLAITNKASAVNVGVFGNASNTAEGGVQVGGLFGLNRTTPPASSAALICDNGNTGKDVFLAKVNGANKVKIDLNGNVELEDGINVKGEIKQNGVVAIRMDGCRYFTMPDANKKANGDIISLNDFTHNFGELVYLASDGKAYKADASSTATLPAVAMVADDSAQGYFLLRGYIRNDDWDTLTIGKEVWASTTAGGITQVKPTGAGESVQSVGFAVGAKTIFFDPQRVIITLGGEE